MISLQQLQAVCMTAAGRKAAAEYLDHLNKFMTLRGIDTPLRQAMFLAQIAHESGDFTRITENLNYSAQGLTNTWPGRFAVDPRARTKSPNAKANALHRKPEAIANSVYADRMGNGSEDSGDGWKYRGRGLKQLTGKENYERCSKAIGVDLVKNPDLLLLPEHAAHSACWYWQWKNINPAADRRDIEAATKVINGGLIGLDERKAYFKRALDALGVPK